MSKKILWVSTFAADMYEASGKHLVASFLDHRVPGRLFLGLEGVSPAPMTQAVAADRVNVYDLGMDAFLANFLGANEDIIPQALGGTLPAPECTCSTPPKPPHDKTHKMPCPGHWFNKNFARWFRKVATMKRAVELHPDTEILIWVDSDCQFTRSPDEGTILRKWFRANNCCFYFKHTRPVMEAGIVGYWLPHGGQTLLNAVVGRYASGNFRKDARWDDSYQIQLALADTKVRAIDLATAVGDHAAVIPFSVVGRYIVHDKGRHGRKLGIMT